MPWSVEKDMDDKEFLKSAIEQSELSVKQGRFPAGAVVVFDNKIVASGVSDLYPGYQHAECRAVDEAFQKIGNLKSATLYTSMEPCLMCLARAYWSGVRKIVFVISKASLNPRYYEGSYDGSKLIEAMNESVEYLHSADLASEALEIVSKWEKIQKA